jgi:ribosomal protein S18 acetylase RimI-like enzyme
VTGPVVRPFRAEDVAAVYDACLRTGLEGGDATGCYADPDLLGHVWAGPFLAIEPEHCLVVEDDDGVAGYSVATSDTRRFEAACEERWWPALRPRHDDPPDGDRGTWSRDEVLAHLVHHPPVAPDAVVAEHPAHLHVDLLPRLQGRGIGRQLMTAMFALLAADGATGVHLGVGPGNTRALGFYDRLGFTELLRAPHVVFLGRPLP